MTILIIQPSDLAPPGELLSRIEAQKKKTEICRVDHGDRVPEDLDAFESLVILGGEMSANDRDEYPFIDKTIKAVKKFHEDEKPVLGICLGSQIIAKTFGATVGKMKRKEFGIIPHVKTADGEGDPVFSEVPKDFSFMQFHEDSFTLPNGATLLATGEYCTNQAFRIGSKTYGVQFHPEVNASIAERWYSEKQEAIEDMPTQQSLTHVQSHLNQTKVWAHDLFDNWLSLT